MRLVASDMDGTIVGRDGSISPRTVAAFKACEAAGVEVVFVTGRPTRWLDPLRRQIGHTGTVICSNGAVTYDLVADQVLAAHFLSVASVMEIHGIIRRLYPAAAFAAETLSGFHLEPGFIDEGSVELLGEFVPAPLAESLRSGDAGVVKLLVRDRVLGPDEFLSGVAPAVAQLATTTHSAPNEALLELSVPGINKSVTLAGYAAALGIEPADVVAFGDMPNDIQMLEWAGHGYAMASGHPTAIAAARHRAPSLADDGVAQVLESLLARR